jgi:hypothetical protein
MSGKLQFRCSSCWVPIGFRYGSDSGVGKRGLRGKPERVSSWKGERLMVARDGIEPPTPAFSELTFRVETTT